MTASQIWLALYLVFATATNIVLFRVNSSWVRWLCLAVGAAHAVLFAAMAYELAHWECFGAPAQVPYHDGMTICPGQSAVMSLELKIPKPGDRI